jgi:aspartyl-tRNA(Asn)/glutamyl-tRNA(Gln) amidotransferase subunit C
MMTMSIGATGIRGIARLARIAIDDADSERYASQVSQILAYVEAMNEVDTSGIEPLAHAVDAVAASRPDAVTERIDRASLQAGAPLVQEGYYLVPRVIE